MSITTAAGAGTHVGRIRQHNEDSYCAAHPVFVVADGMGGHRAGDVASAAVIQCFSALGGLSAVRPATVLAALGSANERILELIGHDGELAGMGTTCVGLVLLGDAVAPRWLAFNVGDSRLYLFAEGLLQRISIDHSEVQEMIDAGEISEEQARSHPRRHIVTRALGSDPVPLVDVWEMPALGGQRWLLCSDGLTGEVSEDVITGVLAGVPHPGSTAQRLVALALEAGGHDNITAVVVDVVEIEDVGAADDTASNEDWANSPDDTLPSGADVPPGPQDRGHSGEGRQE